jgi:hypothetical protein
MQIICQQGQRIAYQTAHDLGHHVGARQQQRQRQPFTVGGPMLRVFVPMRVVYAQDKNSQATVRQFKPWDSVPVPPAFKFDARSKFLVDVSHVPEIMLVFEGRTERADH